MVLGVWWLMIGLLEGRFREELSLSRLVFYLFFYLKGLVVYGFRVIILFSVVNNYLIFSIVCFRVLDIVSGSKMDY